MPGDPGAEMTGPPLLRPRLRINCPNKAASPAATGRIDRGHKSGSPSIACGRSGVGGVPGDGAESGYPRAMLFPDGGIWVTDGRARPSTLATAC